MKLSTELRQSRVLKVNSLEKLAECLSQCPDKPELFQLKLKVNDSWTSLAALLLTTYYEYWETDELVSHIARQAYQHNYEGQWETVQEILETEIRSPKQFEEKFTELRSSQEFYGNLLPFAGSLARILRFRDCSRSEGRKPKAKSRRRGYRDKGTLRLSHEDHGEAPTKPAHEVDRRSKVHHPLVGYLFEGILSSEVEGTCQLALLLNEGGEDEWKFVS